jgi:mannose-6-phosphate isomerase-like protein (cupin superfamily)
MMRHLRAAWISCLAALGCVLGSVIVLSGQDAAPAPTEATGPIVPVHHEPHHRQVFQYGPMRILDLQLPPGDMSWFHTHEWPVFYLTTSDSQTVSQNLGEEWGARGRGAARGGAGRGDVGRGGPNPGAAPVAGAAAGPDAAATPAARGPAPAPAGGRGFRPRLMYDLSYAERAVTHRIRNDGTGLFRSMVVVNETAGGDESVTEEAAGFTGKPLTSNRWFRTYRIALAPGEKTAAHQHKAPVVILQDTTGKGVGTGAVKFEFNEPGQWAFFDTGDRHEVANTGSERLELIEVELRRR